MNQSREFEHLADTDSLTGLINRRQFLIVGESEFERAQRFPYPLIVMMIDVDNFKKSMISMVIESGCVLKTIAGGVFNNCAYRRLLDGGDEFMVLLRKQI
jgi:diguanylate cyclase (GGDEF)-like protein